MAEDFGPLSGSRPADQARSGLGGSRFDPGHKHALDSELIEWRFVPRYRRKGYMDRDFYIGTRRYRHFASGANERGIIRYGFLIDDFQPREGSEPNKTLPRNL